MKKIYTFLALLLIIQSNLFAQLTGIKTINPGGSGSDNYTTFAAAIGDLYGSGVGSGGVIFKVAADAVFHEGQNYITCPTSSAANPIVFKKDGTGANPVIYGKDNGGNIYSVILGVNGSDYITFDGIDLISDPAATLDADKIEYGLGIYNNGSDGSDHITIKNCTILIERRNDDIPQNGINIFQNASSISGIVSNIFVDNVTFIEGRTSISLNAETIPNENIEIKNCKIGDVGTIIQPLDYGAVFNLNKCKNFSFHDNEIQNIVTTNFYVLQMANFTGENNVFNNKIHNMRSTSTLEASDIMGISSTSNDPNAVMNIFNNLLYDFDGAKSTSTFSSNTYWNLQLIYTNGAAKYRIYNNTVVGNSSNPNENTILCWAFPTADIKNNIFADFSVTGANSFRTLFLSTGVIENNIFWIDESLTNNFIYRSGDINYKFREWQKWNTKPSPGYFLSNMSANPNFTDKDKFDFTVKSPSPASNNGQPLSVVTSSLNGVLRNANMPDIGAFEGDFGPATDLFPPLIQFQPIPFNSPDVVKLTAEITDNVGVTSSKLWFRVKGSDVSFTEVPGVQYGNIWQFTFPALNKGAYEYFVCAKDASDNIISNGYIVSGLNVANTGLTVNNPSANPDYGYSFSYKQELSGDTYTVGSGGTYTSLTKPGGLFDAINSSLITGNVGVSIISDLDETGEIVLKQWQESGVGNYTITIKPNSAALRTISNATTNPVSVVGADRVTIDGSYSGDNLNHLKFVADNSNPLKFINDGTNGCSNITIKYCDFFSLTWACIFVSGSYHSDFIIENVNSVKGYSGVTLNNVTRPAIRNCTLGNTDENNTLTNYGIYLSGCTDITVENNTIQNVISSADNVAVYGIWLGNNTGGSISRNKIIGIKNNATVGNEISDGLCAESSNNLTISNNIILGINGIGSSDIDYNFGIRGAVLQGCDNIKFYYNSIDLFGLGNAVNAAESFTISTGNSTNLNISNNIFLNSIYNSNSNSYSDILTQQNFEFSNIFKNNIYYNIGTNANPVAFQIAGAWPDFRGWQSAGFTPGNGRDLGSSYGDPKFTNSASGDVSLQALSPSINSGVPVPVTIDFYGKARNASTPYIGAIEDNTFALTTDIIPPVIDYTPFTSSINTTPVFSVTIKDNVGVTEAKMWYRIQNSALPFTSVDGVKQGDNLTWNFAITSALTLGNGYEYFICAKDAANNIITNGITPSALNVSTVGLTDNAPASHPLFVRTFKVDELSITLGTISGSPFYISSTKVAPVSIPYTKSGIFNNGNIFTAYLSDATGNFSSETEIGSATAGSDNIYEGDYLSVGFREHPTAGILQVNTKLQFVGVNANTVHKAQIGDFTGYGLDITITDESMLVSGVTVYKCNLQITGMPDPSDMGVYSTYNGAPMNYYNPVAKVFELYYYYNIAEPRKIRETNSLISSNNNIDGIINSSVPAGNCYKIRIKSSSPEGIISDVSPDLQIVVDDVTTPVVTLTTSATTPVFTPFTVAIDFNEIVTGFVQSMINVTNATLSDFTAVIPDRKFTVLVSPINSGTVIVKVPANSVKDPDNNFNGESNIIDLSYIELGVPHLNITAAGNVNYFNSSTIVLTFTFDQDVTGFEVGDVSVDNGSISDFVAVTGSAYTAVLTPADQGLVKIAVANDAAINLSSKGNSASSVNLFFDNVKPGVSLSQVLGSGNVNSAFPIYIDFTEEIKGLSLDKISVTNGVATNFIKESATRYRATITPSINNGTVTLGFAADRITDMADNSNTAASNLEVVVDKTAPAVVITRTSGSGAVNSAFNVTFTFSEDVTGFDAADIVVTNGSASGFVKTSPSVYKAFITPDMTGDVIINTAVNVALDLAANPNTAADPLTIQILITGIESNIDDSLTVYPNPSSGLFKIEADIVSEQAVTVVDMNGKLLYNNVIRSRITEVDLQYLQKGTYLLQVINGKKISTRKILITR